jgi:hypothetical protein
MRVFGGALVCVLAAAIGCGTPPASHQTPGVKSVDDGGTVENQNNQMTWECCLNGAYYQCPDDAAFEQCGARDPSGCSRDASKDSSCKSVIKTDGGLPTTPDMAKPVAPTCNAWGTPQPCTLDADCGSGKHCFGGKCWGNDRGAPCSFSYQCGTNNHCTNNCCWWNSFNEPCAFNHDCSSGVCAGGKCK